MIGAASPEERAFADEVNKRLAGVGARVWPFVMAKRDEPSLYCLSVQYGTRRHIFSSDDPFHYDSAEDVIVRVMDWIARARVDNRWTTNLEAADGTQEV